MTLTIETSNTHNEDLPIMNNTSDYAVIRDNNNGLYFAMVNGHKVKGRDKQEVLEKIETVLERYNGAPSYDNVTVKHTDNEALELSIDSVLLARDKFVKENLGYDSFDEFRANQFKIYFHENIGDYVKKDELFEELNDYARQLADMRKQLSISKRENKVVYNPLRKHLKRTTPISAPLFCEYPKSKQQFTSEVLNYHDRVVLYRNYETLSLGLRNFVLKSDSGILNGNNYETEYFRFHGFTSGLLKPISEGKRTHKRSDGKEVLESDNSGLPILRDLTPNTRKQRKTRKLISEYSANSKHYDLITIGNSKPKRLVCGLARDNGNNVIYAPNGDKFHVSSKTAYSYIHKQTGCDLNMIPSHDGRIISFVYGGVKITLDRIIE
jgi:hypothetical protein